MTVIVLKWNKLNESMLLQSRILVMGICAAWTEESDDLY